MKRRNRPGLIVWMLTAVLLCVQSPWAHAQRMAIQREAAQAAQTHAPCHGAELQVVATVAAADGGNCCTDGYCDGHCAYLSWALPMFCLQVSMAAVVPVTGALPTGEQLIRPPALFRPPI